jgi:hypothetical protein
MVGGAAIHGDKQARAFRMSQAHGVLSEPIAFVLTVGDVTVRSQAQRMQGLTQYDGGRDAVDIIVAMDEDRLVALGRKSDP